MSSVSDTLDLAPVETLILEESFELPNLQAIDQCSVADRQWIQSRIMIVVEKTSNQRELSPYCGLLDELPEHGAMNVRISDKPIAPWPRVHSPPHHQRHGTSLHKNKSVVAPCRRG